MYSITHASLLLTLRSRTQPSAARGSAPNRALGRAEEKYQCQGITPHSELLHGHQLHCKHPRSESIGNMAYWRLTTKAHRCMSVFLVGFMHRCIPDKNIQKNSMKSAAQHLFSAVLNQSTSPSGHSQRPQKAESTSTVVARLPAAASAPTARPLLKLICLSSSMCSPTRPAQGSKSQRKITCVLHP
jgi:hypothetical protein